MEVQVDSYSCVKVQPKVDTVKRAHLAEDGVESRHEKGHASDTETMQPCAHALASLSESRSRRKERTVRDMVLRHCFKMFKGRKKQPFCE